MTQFSSKSTLGVAIATFNGARYLKEQLESIRLQTKKVDSIVVYDDGSYDDTLDIAKSYHDIFARDNIDYTWIAGANVGYCRNFERAIAYLDTDLVFLCDQDDVWLPTKVEDSVKYFDQYDDLNVLFTDALVTNSDLIIKRKISAILKYRRQTFIFPCVWPMSRNTCVGATMVLRRTFFQRIFPIPSGQRNHDAWIARCAALTNSLAYLPIPMIYYRQHESNVIGAGGINRSRLQKDAELIELETLNSELQELVSFYEMNTNSFYVLQWLRFIKKRQSNFKKPPLLGLLATLALYKHYRIHLNGLRSLVKDLIILGIPK